MLITFILTKQFFGNDKTEYFLKTQFEVQFLEIGSTFIYDGQAINLSAKMNDGAEIYDCHPHINFGVLNSKNKN